MEQGVLGKNDFENKFPKWKSSVFAIFSKLARDYKAINLAQGFPDFDPPNELLDRVCYHLKNGSNQYLSDN